MEDDMEITDIQQFIHIEIAIEWMNEWIHEWMKKRNTQKKNVYYTYKSISIDWLKRFFSW